jgi:hypothetical protein
MLFWVQPGSRGNVKRSALGEFTPGLGDARVETANVKGKLFIIHAFENGILTFYL